MYSCFANLTEKFLKPYQNPLKCRLYWNLNKTLKKNFYPPFYDVEKLGRKPKIFVKVILRFWYVQHVGLVFLKIHEKPSKLQLWWNSSMLKKPRHVNIIKIFVLNISLSKSKTMTTSICPSQRYSLSYFLTEKYSVQKSWWWKQ